MGGEIAGPRDDGGYGYTVGARSPTPTSLPDSTEPGTAVEIEIFGRWVGGEVAREPLFDPSGERIRA